MANSLFNTQYILTRNRYPWVDYARGICIILVCYRHTYEGLANAHILQPENYSLLQFLNVFFFSFRMPLFFIISGIFVSMSLQKKGLSKFIEDRFRFLFYPFLIWGVIQITLQLIFSNYINANREPIHYLYLLIAPREIEQFWYLNALFCVNLLYVFLKVKFKFNYWQQLGLGLLLSYIGYFCVINYIQLGFLGDVFFFYPFFAIGDGISTIITNPEKRHQLLGNKALLLSLPFFLLGQYFFTRINLGNHDDYYMQRFMPLAFSAIALIGCLFIMNISYLLQKLRAIQFLRVIGYHSLYIYVMHLMVIAACRVLYTRVFGFNNVYVFMAIGLVTGIFIPIIIYNLAERMGMGWLFELKKNIKSVSSETTNRLKQLNSPKTEKTVAF